MKTFRLSISDFENVFDNLELAHPNSADAPNVAFFNSTTGKIERPGNDAAIDRCRTDVNLVEFPAADSTLDIYGRMLDFIDSVEDGATRIALDRVTKGRGAFRRFKDFVEGGDDNELRASWKVYTIQSKRQRIMDWLNLKGIDPDWGCDIFDIE